MTKIPESCSPVNARFQLEAGLLAAESRLREEIALQLTDLRHRKAIFKAFHAIWQARRYDTVLRRYLKVVRTYRHSQPEAVATLRRDFRSTITYYPLEQQFPVWDRKYLCTTSRLERFNRRIRRRARAACAYHSDQGLLAMVAQEAHLFHAAQRHEQFPPN